MPSVTYATWPTPPKPSAPVAVPAPTRAESDEELLARVFYITGKADQRLMQELSQVSASAQLDAIADRYHLKRRQVPL